MSSTQINLLLGDIIEIVAPSNDTIHKEIFFTYQPGNQTFLGLGRNLLEKPISNGLNKAPANNARPLKTIQSTRRLNTNTPY